MAIRPGDVTETPTASAHPGTRHAEATVRECALAIIEVRRLCASQVAPTIRWTWSFHSYAETAVVARFRTEFRTARSLGKVNVGLPQA